MAAFGDLNIKHNAFTQEKAPLALRTKKRQQNAYSPTYSLQRIPALRGRPRVASGGPKATDELKQQAAAKARKENKMMTTEQRNRSAATAAIASPRGGVSVKADKTKQEQLNMKRRTSRSCWPPCDLRRALPKTPTLTLWECLSYAEAAH